MSKVEKILLITFAALVPVGIILVVLGLRFGGAKGWSVNLSDMKYTDNSNMVEKTLDLDEFDEVAAEIASADLTVETGDSYQLYYRVKEGREPEVNQSGKKLSIKKPLQITLFSFDFDFDTESEKYVLTVPADKKEYRVDLVTSSGSITVEKVAMTGKILMSSGDILLRDFDSAGLEIKASSGDLVMENVNPENITITMSSGSIKASGMSAKSLKTVVTSGEMCFDGITSEEADFKLSSGEVIVNDGTIDRVNAKMTSGDLKLNLNGNRDDYDVEFSATSGNLTLDGEEIDKNYLKNTGSDKKIVLKATSGDIDVNFN